MSDNVDLCILVVLYSVPHDESLTLKSIRRALIEAPNCFDNVNLTLTIWDNSERGHPLPDSSYYPNVELDYYTSLSNIPLSQVYNSVVSKHSSDYYIILDDDSILSQDYFVAVKKAITSKCDLSCPRIRSYETNDFLSPGYYKGLRGKVLEFNDVASDVDFPLVAMMSGTVISKLLLSQVSFDERLELYGVDTKFYLDSSYLGFKVNILDVTLNHKSGLREYKSIEEHSFRLESLYKSRYVVFESLNLYKFRVSIYILFSIIKLSFSNPRYLKLLIKLFLR